MVDIRFIKALLPLLAASLLLVTGCQKVVLKEDVIPPQSTTQAAAKPFDFRVVKIESAVDASGPQPRLVLFLLVENPNDFPRSLRGLQVDLYDKLGRLLGYQSWMTDRSPFIFGAEAKVPLAVGFTGISEWQAAKASFLMPGSPDPAEVHEELKSSRYELKGEENQAVVEVTVQNPVSAHANDVIVLVAGYDSAGGIVAWGDSRQHWRQLAAGDVSTFATNPLLGNPAKITAIKAFISAIKSK